MTPSRPPTSPSADGLFTILGVAVIIAAVVCAASGCRPRHPGDGCVTPTHEQGDTSVGYGPKNPCPCGR